MDSLDFETDGLEPVFAECRDGRIFVTLKDGRGVSAPLEWYPFLEGSSQDDLDAIELHWSGIWWDHVDEGISIKSMFLGWKPPQYVEKPAAA